MKPLILFGTAGCHLCDDAQNLIAQYLQGQFEQMVDQIDIAEQEQWQECYGIRIPVLYHPETQKELGWPFDRSAVSEFISALGIGA